MSGVIDLMKAFSGDRKPFGYIYETENLISHRKYIGMHQWNEYSIDESYLGSGVALKDAVESYGSENFSCRIIEFCYSYEELCEREAFWIALYGAVDSEEYYNLIDGGRSGICTYESLSDAEKEIFKARSGANARKWFSDEENKKRWLSILRSDLVNKRRLESSRRFWSDRERREKLVQHRRDTMKKHWSIEENIEAHRGLMQKVHNTPEAVENHRKAAIEINSRPEVKEKIRKAHLKRVMCIELDMIFECAQAAMDYLGIKANNTSNIRNSANTYKQGKKHAAAYGYHFIYVDD